MIHYDRNYSTNSFKLKMICIVLFLVSTWSYSYVSNTAVAKDSLVIDTTKNKNLVKPIKNIKQKYSGRDFVYTEKAVQLNFWERFKLWLAQKVFEFFNMSSVESSGKVIVVILRIIGILLVLFVIYKIVMHLMNEDGNWIFGRKSDKVQINASDIDTDIHQMDFKQLIEESISKKNYRLAIRYYYLLVLKKLSDKDKIIWDNEKTNYDYYQELGNSEIKKQFQYISYIYDYCWYGEFNIDEREYETGKNAFQKLIETLK